jgi:hypothetical protein
LLLVRVRVRVRVRVTGTTELTYGIDRRCGQNDYDNMCNGFFTDGGVVVERPEEG